MDQLKAPVFSSERLHCFRPSLNDLPFFRSLVLNEKGMKKDGGIYNEIQIEKAENVIMDHWENHDFDHYLCVLKTDMKPIGTVRISFTSDVEEKSGILSLGFNILPDYWGTGLPTEAVKTLVGYAVSSLHFKKFHSISHLENFESSVILERAGFRKTGIEEVETKVRKYGSCNKWIYLHESKARSETKDQNR